MTRNSAPKNPVSPIGIHARKRLECPVEPPGKTEYPALRIKQEKDSGSPNRIESSHR